MALVTKDFPTLAQQTSQRLVALGLTDAIYQGTPTATIVQVTDFHLADVYSDMGANLSTQYLSTASGDALDGLVLILGIYRRGGESDQSLRIRATSALIQQDPTNGAAISAILGALSGVRQVIGIPYTNGIGTITYYLIGTLGLVPTSTVALAQQTASSNISAGGFVIIDTPSPLLVNIVANLALSTAPVNTVSILDSLATSALVNYLNGLTMGSVVVYDQLIAAVLGASTDIVDVQFVSITTTDVNGNVTEQLLDDITPMFNQQALPGVITVQ